jgi:hypothetical protein
MTIRPRYLFNPPNQLTPFIVISSRRGVPYFREHRCLPQRVGPHEDFMLLSGGWTLAVIAQFVYSILWVIFQTLGHLPWLLVHCPWFFLIFLSGYAMSRLALLQHPAIHKEWIRIFFTPYCLQSTPTAASASDLALVPTEETEDETSDDTTPVATQSWERELIVSMVSVFLLSLIGETIVQCWNDQRMRSRGWLSILSLISKSLFFLNILNRLFVLQRKSVVVS